MGNDEGTLKGGTKMKDTKAQGAQVCNRHAGSASQVWPGFGMTSYNPFLS